MSYNMCKKNFTPPKNVKQMKIIYIFVMFKNHLL